MGGTTHIVREPNEIFDLILKRNHMLTLAKQLALHS